MNVVYYFHPSIYINLSYSEYYSGYRYLILVSVWWMIYNYMVMYIIIVKVII